MKLALRILSVSSLVFVFIGLSLPIAIPKS